MKVAKLIHNPSAGDEDHSKKELVSLIESKGFECHYSSAKDPDWEIEDDTDFLIIAGGDGTVRKAVKKLVARNLLEKQFPIALLPRGTANNIAATLGLGDDSAKIVQSWNFKNIKKIDLGKISGAEELFFLEGFGFGVFPRLIKEMKETADDPATPQEALEKARNVLIEIIDSYKPKSCTIDIDGTKHSGKYLLVEILNIRSIGPNLDLAPTADPGDGLFEVVLIADSQKDLLKEYVLNKLQNINTPVKFNSILAKNIMIKWDGKLAHVDDELIEINKQEVKVQILEGVLDFLVK